MAFLECDKSIHSNNNHLWSPENDSYFINHIFGCDSSVAIIEDRLNNLKKIIIFSFYDSNDRSKISVKYRDSQSGNDIIRDAFLKFY